MQEKLENCISKQIQLILDTEKILRKLEICHFDLVKFTFTEKATKINEIFTIDLTFTT